MRSFVAKFCRPRKQFFNDAEISKKKLHFDMHLMHPKIQGFATLMFLRNENQLRHYLTVTTNLLLSTITRRRQRGADKRTVDVAKATGADRDGMDVS